jgi:hypothetical protein
MAKNNRNGVSAERRIILPFFKWRRSAETPLQAAIFARPSPGLPV